MLKRFILTLAVTIATIFFIYYPPYAHADQLKSTGTIDVYFSPTGGVTNAVAEATYKDIKSDYSKLGLESRAHPNAVSSSLDAAEVRFNIPIIYTSRNKKLAEEKAASWLSKHYTYWYLEENGFGMVLQEGDL